MAQFHLRLRLFFVLAILAWVAASPVRALAAAASPGHLESAHDLAADGRQARQSQLPILLFYSRADCPWCDRARREHLLPLARENPPRAIVRQIDIDQDAPLADFAGKATTHRRYAQGVKARLTPTLGFVGPDGQPLAESIIGYKLADFYGAYIDRAIDDARVKLKDPAP